MSGAPKKYLKPAEALVDKMLRRKPPVASAEKAEVPTDTALDKTKNTPAKKSPAAGKEDPAKKSPAAAKKDPAKKSPAPAKKDPAKKSPAATGKRKALRETPVSAERTKIARKLGYGRIG